MWQLGLISSAVYHMGDAVLRFRARLLLVLDALFQAPSKARPRSPHHHPSRVGPQAHAPAAHAGRPDPGAPWRAPATPTSPSI